MVLGNRAQVRQVESEGVLRLLLLALAIAMPLMTLVYLKVQSTRLGYRMNEVQSRINQEQETQRKLMLERSRWQRDEEIQSYAVKAGMQPKKQGRLIQRAFSAADQREAKLRPVNSWEELNR
ncbi:MAG TPA: hypothetical protein VFM84_05815 [Holophagaceae bacterium]|nr:hypothetical protein [Holophagaceae bacterium]